LTNKIPRNDLAFEKVLNQKNNQVIPLDENGVKSEFKDSYKPNPIEIIWKNLKVDV